MIWQTGGSREKQKGFIRTRGWWLCIVTKSKLEGNGFLRRHPSETKKKWLFHISFSWRWFSLPNCVCFLCATESESAVCLNRCVYTIDINSFPVFPIWGQFGEDIEDSGWISWFREPCGLSAAEAEKHLKKGRKISRRSKGYTLWSWVVWYKWKIGFWKIYQIQKWGIYGKTSI